MIDFRGAQYHVVTLDFETFFEKGYTLSSMPTSAYVRDPRFLAHMVGIKIDDAPTEIHTYRQIRGALKAVDWRASLLLCHNTAFDGFILSQRYGIKPAGYLDTLSMARAVLGHGVKHKLDNVGRLLGLGGKQGSESLAAAKGIRQLPPELLAKMSAYCSRDVDLCRDVFWAMYNHFPDDELELVDLTLRMFCQPSFEIDQALVQEELDDEIAGKMRALVTTGASKSALLSNPRFVGLVAQAGHNVAQKVSKKTGKWAPALAKTDQGMKDMLASPIDRVRALAQARLTLKSTIGETRAKRFLETAQTGRMPVLLNYYGAHTGRWSGGNKMNMQNLPRPDYLPDKSLDPKTGRLRRSLLAPKGQMIVVADSGQIEARVNAWLAGQHDVLDVFRAYDRGAGPDLYRVMAAKLFNVPIDQVTKDQRFIGKVVCLACGYGMGPAKLVDTMANAKPTPVYITLEQAAEWIHTYRQVNNMIKRAWKRYNSFLPRMTMKTCEIPVGPLTLVYEAVRLPNGLFIRYPDIKVSAGEWENSIGEASFAGRNGVRTKLYGGLLCENWVQALSRCIIAEQMLTLSREGIKILTTTHDEIVAMAPRGRAERTFNRMVEVMSTPPLWAPDLPLAAEGGFAENYSK